MNARISVVSVAGAMVLAVAGGVMAQAPQVVLPGAGLEVLPFAGQAAGFPSLSSPKFGVVDMPGGPLGGMMYISELGGREVSQILPSGVELPFTFLAGLTPVRCYGVDIDGPTANLPRPTRGLYGGPPAMMIAQDAAAVGAGATMLRAPMPGSPGGWLPWFPPVPANPGMAQLQFDRSLGFAYGGFMYYADWGPDQSDGIYVVLPNGNAFPFAPLPGMDPRYFTFDCFKAGGYGPGDMWVTSYNTGQVLSILPGGMVAPPLAVLAPGIEGLAFSPGLARFGAFLYVANLPRGTIDIVMNNGVVVPFAVGFPGAAYLMFVTDGPYARNGQPTLYVADGNDSVWLITHCPADFNSDNNIDPDDLGDFITCYFGEATTPGTCPQADYNADGEVNPDDLGDFITTYFSIPC